MVQIEEILRSLKGHRVTIGFYSTEEPKLREISGVLVAITAEVITFKIYDTFGGFAVYNINRRSCIIHSVVDEEGK